MKTADEPFQFCTASYLTRVASQKASNISELLDGLEECSDASIFCHTFQSLREHHFLTEGFSNDFAHWVLAACNKAELAKAMAALDIRDYLSLADLRRDLRRLVADFCAAHRDQAEHDAFEPFHFCEGIEVAVPVGFEAKTLAEFRQGVERMSNASFYYHFINSRLRLPLRTNDFSHWFSSALGMKALAERVNHIDIYTNTLEGARSTLLQLVDREVA